MDKQDLYKGAYVVWDGEEQPDIKLFPGHPGRIWDPSWQDVGVTWAGMGQHALANDALYDYEDLRLITAEEYEERCRQLPASSYPTTERRRPRPPA